MRRVLSSIFVIGLLLSGTAFAQSQPGDSLGDVARANRAQQQTQEASGTTPKVITNQDLPPGSTPAPPSNTSDSMTMVSGVNKSNRFADQQLSNRLQAEQRTSAQWKTRIQEQENRIADLQARIDRVNASIHSSVGSAQYETPANRNQAVQMQRRAMMQETLNQQKQRLAIMEDAARRSGMDQ
jgi:hypothetical protein